MEKDISTKRQNPCEKANLFSVITFTWLLKTIFKGFRKDLQSSDLFSPLEEDSSKLLGDRISELWKEEENRCKCNKNQPSLLRVLFKCFRGQILSVGLIQAVLVLCLRFPLPIIVGKLLRYFNGQNEMFEIEAFYWATFFVLSYFINSVIFNICAQKALHVGMKINVACCSLIYRKVLRLSKSSIESETTSGKIVNFLSNDVDNLDRLIFSLHYLWIVPLQFIMILYIVYQDMQWAAVLGLSINLLVLPAQVYIGKWVSYFTVKCSLRSDKLLCLLNEIINGVQVIKMYTWEKPFSYLVERARSKQLNVIKRISIFGQLSSAFKYFIPRLSLFITVLSYSMMKGNISAEKVYMVAGFFNELGGTSSALFSLGIYNLNKGLVSMRRLNDFLTKEETQRPFSNLSFNQEIKHKQANVVLSLKNASAKWLNDSKEYTLKNINITLKTGTVTAIIGQVGSGKTSLLNAILGELSLIEGAIQIQGKISYVSQEPWIFASSMRQNILFGQPMDEKRFRRVTEVCQLNQDLSTFPHGDQTVVGEKGVKLSGGQRARVNLARAVYSDADIYLLDDPLSAVDSNVGRLIFENCISHYLKGKTIILVTHQLQYLQNVDQVFVLNNGEIQNQGTFQELQVSGLDFVKVLPSADEINDDFFSPQIVKSEDKYAQNEPSEKDETMNTGKVSGKVYLEYLRAVESKWLLFVIFLLTLAFQLTATGSDFLLAFWVNNQRSSKSTGNNTLEYVDQTLKQEWYICIYSGLIVLLIILFHIHICMFFEACVRASKRLHASMFYSVVHTSMAFFYSNSSGRIMNRFSKDMSTVDQLLPKCAMDIILRGISIAAAIAINLFFNPLLLIPTAFIGTLLYIMRQIFIRASRNIKRLEGITRSPVFSHLTATLQGLTTIRAAGRQDSLSIEFDYYQDLHTSSNFLFFSCERATSFYMQLVSSIYISIITFIFVFYDRNESSGNMGLILTQCILFSDSMHWVIKIIGEAETQMTSVERILEYSKLEEESPLVSKLEAKIEDNWPKDGSLEFKNVYLKYSLVEETVLKDISFVVRPKEKVGIVGRTGAGKSSLIATLFRLAYIDGEIYMDGVPASCLGLQELRSKIGVIPQEPILFAGDVRRNLDPLEEYSDDDLWQVLSEVEIKNGLYAKVSDSGSNFSVGQRQLLCLARALVRRNKILVLDEATANVDPKTDKLIQSTIRKRFMDCTVLIIAHRLNTVIDCDKILVLDAGRLVEYDHPFLLLQNKQGHFHEMVRQTGPATMEFLTKTAKNNYCKTSDYST